MQQNQDTTMLNTDDDEIDLLSLLNVLLDNKVFILGVTLAGLIFSTIYSFTASPIYKANALLQVEKKSSGLAGLDDLKDAIGGRESKSITEIELIRSRAVIAQVVDQLNLDIRVTPKYFPLFGKTLAKRFSKTNPDQVNTPVLGLSSFAWGGEKLQIETLELPDMLEGKKLSLIAQDNNSYVVYDDTDTQLVQGQIGKLAEANGAKFLISNLQARSGTEFVVVKQPKLQTIVRYQTDLEITEKGKESGILTLALQGLDPTEITQVLDHVAKQYVQQNIARNSAEAANSLAFLQERLPSVKADLEKASDRLNAYQKSAKSVDVLGETQGVLKESVELEAKLTEMKFLLADIERRFTPQHPNYKVLQKQVAALEQERGQVASKTKLLPETQQEILRLTRDVQVNTEIYAKVLNKIQELDVVRAGTVGNARIIDNAVVDVREPVAPKKGMIITLATLVGLFLACLVVFIRRALNLGVETPEQIEKFGLPVYAAIPLSEQQKTLTTDENFKGDKLLAVQYPNDVVVEAFRSLRTSLHFSMMESSNNCIMISGPSPSIGKSFVSANLAVVLAQGGQRVLLIDADMRKGYVHAVFGYPYNHKGLSDYLTKRGSWEECLLPTQTKNLTVMARGKAPPNPAELLMHRNFNQFIEKAKTVFDLVLIDTPPLLAVTDAAVVGRLAGTTLLVTRYKQSTMREIKLTVDRFAHNGVSVRGIIFNALERKANRYGYGYYQYEYKAKD